MSSERLTGTDEHPIERIPDAPSTLGRWVVALGGPAVWITHFMVVYLAAEVSCAGLESDGWSAFGEDALVADRLQRRVEALEEGAGTQDHDVDAVERPQPLLLAVQAGDEPVAARQLAADRAQRDHVAHTTRADRRSDRLAAPVLIGVVIGQGRVERGERVDRVGAYEGACQVVGVADIAVAPSQQDIDVPATGADIEPDTSMPSSQRFPVGVTAPKAGSS